jgi:chromosome segregation ATPase
MIISAAIIAAVAAKYLIPALIAVGLLGTGFAGGYYYHLHVVAQAELAMLEELMQLRRESIQRHANVRDSVNRLAHRTDNHIETTIQQHNTQQQLIAQNIIHLEAHTEHIHDSAHSLDEIASSLTSTTSTISEHMTDVQEDMNSLKTELTSIRERLKTTQSSLNAKEMLLNQVVNQLINTQKTLNNEAISNTAKVTELSHQLATALTSLNHPNQNIEIREAELTALKKDNRKMAATITQLEDAINRFILQLNELKQTNSTQMMEFQKLLVENKQLQLTIQDLSHNISLKKSASSENNLHPFAQTLSHLL